MNIFDSHKRTSFGQLIGKKKNSCHYKRSIQRQENMYRNITNQKQLSAQDLENVMMNKINELNKQQFNDVRDVERCVKELFQKKYIIQICF